MKNIVFALATILTLMVSAGAHAQQDAGLAPAAPAPVADTTLVITQDPVATVQPAPAPAATAGNEEIIAALPPTGTAAASTAPVSIIEKEINEQLAYLKPNINVDTMKSLFYTVWEHDLILDARRGLTTRVPGTDDGLASTLPRDITLGGIVYHSGKEWTIWLNNARVAPDAIPTQVLDLKVFKEYVELEWFDETTNQVYPIRLRAHQRFNLDTRMFLPG